MADDTMIMMDMGKQKKKNVKALRNGAGPLAEEVRGAIAELRTNGDVKPDAEVIVVVVESKPKKSSAFFG